MPQFVNVELVLDSSPDSELLYSQEDFFKSSSIIHKSPLEVEFMNYSLKSIWSII